MYSKEDRERILADLGASGLTPRGFSRLPGNPSAAALRRWLRQAELGELDVPRREVRGRVTRPKHSRYPEATKREALSLLRKGMGPSAVARRLGVSSGAVVSSWSRKAAGSASMMPRKGAVRMDADAARARISELEAELADARMSLEVLKEMVRDPKSGGPARMSNRRKAGLGERLRRECGCPLKDVLAFLRISKSSYEYARRSLERSSGREARVGERVRSAFEASGRTYGYRRVRAAIAAGADGGEPMAVSEREVRAAMRAGGMAARRTRRRRRWSSYAGETDARPANLPLGPDGRHDFSAPEPWRMAVTDVTEFKVRGGKAYLSPVIDCFDGEPAAWTVSGRPDSALTDSSLEGYLAKRPAGLGALIEHSDGGATYRSASWKRICEEGGVTRSMSRRGCCPDNARAEGFFGTLKEEFYNGRDWSQVGFDEFRARLDAYIEWYVDGRLKAFDEGGRKVYDTIAGRRRRLGYTV